MSLSHTLLLKTHKRHGLGNGKYIEHNYIHGFGRNCYPKHLLVQVGIHWTPVHESHGNKTFDHGTYTSVLRVYDLHSLWSLWYIYILNCSTIEFIYSAITQYLVLVFFSCVKSHFCCLCIYKIVNFVLSLLYVAIITLNFITIKIMEK